MITIKTLDEAWELIVSGHTRDPHGIHGPRHWAVVERNGLYIAKHSGAKQTIVSLFALFHDSCRVNDWDDPEHGPRAAVYAREMRGALRLLVPEDKDFDLLLEACEGHTHITHHENPTIATCWDADRLDLGRVGVEPDPKYLNTDSAKFVAVNGVTLILQELPLRTGLV